MVFRRSNNLQIQKELLRGFWANFGGTVNRWIPSKNDFSKKGQDKKLKFLREYSNIVFIFKNGMSLAEKRQKFLKRKKYKGYLRRGFCFVCGIRTDLIRHHIIQLQNGGYNSKRNIVVLCENCHSDVHPWLKIKNGAR